MTRRNSGKMSLQERIRNRQHRGFVARETQVALFRENLALNPEDDRYKFIFNIWGQGGVGKTTLLKRYLKIVTESGGVAALANDEQGTVPETLACLARVLKEQGHELKNFDKKYQQYKEKREALEADADAPSGIYGYGARVLTRTGFALAKTTPIGTVFAELADEEVFTDHVAEFAEFARKKLGGKSEDVKLVLNPEEVLTPIFFDDLDKICAQKKVLFCFDTYEQTGIFLDGWLRSFLDGAYGDVSDDLIIVIAGRKMLDENLWQEYEGIIGVIPLEPFSEEEARLFLKTQQVENEEVVSLIMELSGRLPLLLAMLAKEAPQQLDEVGDPTETAVERFLKWVDDPEQRQLAIEAALPRVLNEDIIKVLTSEEKSAGLFAWLCEMPFVSEDADGWKYHQVVRSQMFRGLRKRTPERFAKVHETLAQYFDHCRSEIEQDFVAGLGNETWRDLSRQYLYHRLCINPNINLLPSLNECLVVYREKWRELGNWAEDISAAGHDLNDSQAIRIGTLLIDSYRYFDKGEDEKLLQVIMQLEKVRGVDPIGRSALQVRKGYALLFLNRNENALAAFDQALEMDPQYKLAIRLRGHTLQEMKRYEDALAAFDQALEMDPQYKLAILERGCTLREMKRYEDALAAFDRALEIDPQYQWAMDERGVTLREMKRYEDALAAFDCALEIDPKEDWSYYNRALIHTIMKSSDNAIADFSRAISFAQSKYQRNPKNWGNIFNLSVYHLAAGHFEDAERLYHEGIRGPDSFIRMAIIDIDEFLHLFPNHTEAHAFRSYLKQHQDERTNST